MKLFKKDVFKCCDSLNDIDFCEFYDNFAEKKSESREISKVEISLNDIRYYVTFKYTMNTKNKTYVRSIEDKVPFKSYEDAELYVQIAEWPSTLEDDDYTEDSWDSKIRKHIYTDCIVYLLNLKHDDEIKNYFESYVRVFVEKHKTAMFFVLGDYIDPLWGKSSETYQKRTFKELLDTIKESPVIFDEPKVISVFNTDIKLDVKSEQELKELKGKRNAVAITEIERAKEYIKFLEGLI